MRFAGETVGGRGVTLMAVTAVVGIVLGVHGWSGRHNGLPSSLANPQPSVSAKAQPSATPSGPAGAAQSPPAQGPPAHGPTVSPSSSPTPSAAAPSPGPELSKQSYASYAFLVWPGTPSSAAQAAEIGLSIKVVKQGSGISVTAGVAGQAAQPPRSYPTGTHVYVIEASLGDDSGNSDYNLGDDGLVVTDAQGRILQ